MSVFELRKKIKAAAQAKLENKTITQQDVDKVVEKVKNEVTVTEDESLKNNHGLEEAKKAFEDLNKSETQISLPNVETSETLIESSTELINESETDIALSNNSVETPIAEEIAEEKTSPKRKRRKLDANEKKDFGKTEVLQNEKFSYKESAADYADQYIDEEWKAYEKIISDKLDNIRIEADMNPGTLKYTLAELNNLYDEISLPLIEQKKILDSLTDKDFGVATIYKAVNSVDGGNEDERKRNGILALMSAGEKKINLMSLIAATRMRYTFLQEIYNRIQYKSKICITMSGAMKIEASFNGE